MRLDKTYILFTKIVITLKEANNKNYPTPFLAWLSGNIFSKYQRYTCKTRRKRIQNVCFTRRNFQRKLYFGTFFRRNEIITQNVWKVARWSIKWRLILLQRVIHPMQIWRTIPSSSGTSCMKARLVGPRCFVLTSFLRKALLRSRSRLVYFAMSTSMPPEGSEIFHRKESFFSFPVRLWGENWRRKGVRTNSRSPSER